MADRKRSEDGRRDSDDAVFGPDETVSHGGRTGGTLQRKVASRDEKKRATERPSGVTRVRKSDEPEDKDA